MICKPLISYAYVSHADPPLQPASGFINRSVSTAELAGTITFAEDLVSKGKRYGN